MTVATLSRSQEPDLAGDWEPDPSLWLILQRVRSLQRRYATPTHFRDRLADLPAHLAQPTVRPWGAIAWREVHPDQLIGIDRATFCATLLGTINTEAPIRGYTQSSRQYLARQYPAMARYVGGCLDESGQVVEVGLWEREEKRHTPALVKLYTRLSGQPPELEPHAARPYRPMGNPEIDLYRHGLHRVATEYGATCLYLWMMAHSTGALQSVLAELLIDEVNHMATFWGFGMWAYPDSSLTKIGLTLGRAMVRKVRDRASQGSLFHTLNRMMHELAWEQWSPAHRVTLLYAFDQVIKALWVWNRELTPAYLNSLLGEPPLGENATTDLVQI